MTTLDNLATIISFEGKQIRFENLSLEQIKCLQTMSAVYSTQGVRRSAMMVAEPLSGWDPYAGSKWQTTSWG